MNLLLLSWKNIINKPLSMALSLLLFALGIGLISLLLVINEQVQSKFDKNLAGIDLVIGAKGSPLQLILSGMYHIDAPTGNIPLKAVKPFLNPEHPLIEKAVPLSLGDNYKGYRIVGTSPDFTQLYQLEIQTGNFWNTDFEVTIGSDVADNNNLKIGDEFYGGHGLLEDDNLAHDDAPKFKVVGILKPSGSVADQLILTATESIWRVHDVHSNEEHVHTEDGNHSHEHDSDIEEGKEVTLLLVKFRGRNFRTLNMGNNINRNTDMLAATPAIEITRLYSLMGVGMDALRALAYVIVAVSGLSIFIFLYASLKERKYELALIRIMGASRSKLLILILTEGLLLACIGYVLGIILSHISMELLSDYVKKAYRYTLSGWHFLPEELYLLAGAILIGIIAALLPALQAYKTDISSTLTDGK